jgi:hypothetical protein
MKIRRQVSHPTMDFILDETEDVSLETFIPGDKIRVGFEEGNLMKVTFDLKSGASIIYERVDEHELPTNSELSNATKQGR